MNQIGFEFDLPTLVLTGAGPTTCFKIGSIGWFDQLPHQLWLTPKFRISCTMLSFTLKPNQLFVGY